MQDRAKNLALERRDPRQLDQRGRDEGATGGRAQFLEHPVFGAGHIHMRRNARARGFVDDGAAIGGQVPRVAHMQRVHRALEHGQQIVGDILLHIEAAQSGAALARRLERAFDNRLHRLFRQRGRIHDHRVQPPGFRHQRRAGGEVFGHCGADFQRGRGRSGKGDPGHPRVRSQRRANRTAAGQQLQRIARHAGAMQQRHGQMRDQRCLFRRFRQHRIAGGQRGGDLAGEDCQRKIPRADAGEHPGRVRVGNSGGVIAQEIHRLAQLGNGVGQALAGLAGEQGKDFAETLLVEIGGPVQDRAAFGGAVVPGPRSGQRGFDIRRRGGRNRSRAVGGIGRVDDGLFGGRGHIARQQRRGAPAMGAERCARRVDGSQRRRVGQVEPTRIEPFRGEHGGSGGNGRGIGTDRLERVRGDGFGWHVVIHDLVDERRIRAVFQQPPHQIGQQVAMGAHRRIDAAAVVFAFLDDPVQAFAHAVQTLEFIGPVACHVQDRGDRMRVMGGELRIDTVGHAQQLAGIGDVGNVGRGFAGKDRKGVHARHLRPLDLGIPIGTFDQPHHDPAVMAIRHREKLVDHGARAWAIGLHHDAEPVPAGQCRFAQHSVDHLERQRQPVGLFRVDVQPHARRFRQQRQ